MASFVVRKAVYHVLQNQRGMRLVPEANHSAEAPEHVSSIRGSVVEVEADCWYFHHAHGYSSDAYDDEEDDHHHHHHSRHHLCFLGAAPSPSRFMRKITGSVFVFRHDKQPIQWQD